MNNAIERLRKQFVRQDALLKALKNEGFKISKKLLTEKLKGNEDTLELTRAKKLTTDDFRPVVASNVGSNLQFDFMYLPNYKRNRNFRYALLGIDIFSRKAWIRPSKTRENPGKQIVKMLEEDVKLEVSNINCDQEFNTKVMNDYADHNKIKMWYSTRDQVNKNANVERLVRTFRNILLRYERTNKERYIDNLEKIIEDNYNDVKHSSIKQTPNDVFNGDVNPKRKLFRNFPTSDIKEGDIVKMKEEEGQFTKRSSTGKFSVQNYLVVEGNGYTYKLRNLRTNTTLVKPFRYYELRKVPIDSLRTKAQRNKVNNFIDRNKEDNRNERIERLQKQAGIDESNVVTGKRQRKKKEIIDI